MHRQTGVEPLEARIAPAVVITGALSAAVQVDNDGDGLPDPGDTLRYTATVDNFTPSDTAALNTQIQALLHANTTLIPGSVNVTPLAINDSFIAAGNTLLRVGGAAGAGPEVFVAGGSVTANDTDFLGDSFAALAIANGASANGGVVNLAADGTFTYVSAPGFTGADTFTYTVRDDGPDNVAGNADDLTNTGTVTVTVNSTVWWVDNAYAGANGASNGTSTRPYTSLTPFTAAGELDEPGDTIFVQKGSGSTTGNITLENNQRFLGAAQTLVVDGFTLVTGNAANRPTLSGAVTLGSGNQLRGFNITTAAGTAISGTNVGTVQIRDIGLATSAGGAISLTTGTAEISLNSISSAGGASGVSLTGIFGTFLNTGATTSNEKSAVFWEMGRSCPLHCAQPVGAKLKPKILISATKGEDMAQFGDG